MPLTLLERSNERSEYIFISLFNRITMDTKLQTLKDYLVYVIEHEANHYWGDPGTCHCGMLLKCTNLFEQKVIDQVAELSEDFDSSSGVSSYYENIFNMYINPNCEVTNLPFTTVLNELINKGFTLDELIKLEHLADNRFNENAYDYFYASNLIQYLNNWISYEEQVSVKQSTKSTVTVSV